MCPLPDADVVAVDLEPAPVHAQILLPCHVPLNMTGNLISSIHSEMVAWAEETGIHSTLSASPCGCGCVVQKVLDLAAFVFGLRDVLLVNKWFFMDFILHDAKPPNFGRFSTRLTICSLRNTVLFFPRFSEGTRRSTLSGLAAISTCTSGTFHIKPIGGI